MKLYELTAKFAALMDRVEAEQGEYADPEQATIPKEEIDAAFTSLSDKLEACSMYAKNSEAEHAAFKAEAQRLAAKAKAAENRAKGIKAYMLGCLEAAKLSKLKAGVFSIGSQNNPPAVDVDPKAVDKLPAEYVINVPGYTVPPSKQVNTAAILTHWQEHREEENFTLPEGIKVTQGKHVRIR